MKKRNKTITYITSIFVVGILAFSVVYITKDNNKIPNDKIEKEKIPDKTKEKDTNSFGIETDVEELPNPPIELTKLILPVEQNVQENGYYCVPATLQMLFKYKNISITQDQLAIELNTSPETGTEYIDLARVANKYLFNNENVGENDPGYHIQTINRYDDDPQIALDFERRVKTNISNNDPTFVAVDVNALYPHLSSANHMVLLVGYSTFGNTDNIAYYYYIDPSYVVQDPIYGGLKIVTKEKLVDAIIQNVEPAYIW